MAKFLMSEQHMQENGEDWKATAGRLREKYEHTLEAAINDHSCTLACFISLCRDNGATFGQQQIIEQYRDKYDQWKETLGSMFERPPLVIEKRNRSRGGGSH